MKTSLLLVASMAAVAFSTVVQQKMQKVSSFRNKLKNGQYNTGRGPQRDAALESASGSAPILDYYDDLYLTTISLGTPAQEFIVSVDTGKADTWVIDASCQTQICKGLPDSNYTKHQFDTSKSSTFTDTGKKFTLDMGVLEVNHGYIGTDVLDLGGVVLPMQDLLISTTVSQAFGHLPIDGVLGLAWPALAFKNTVPVMQSLLKQLDSPLFTIWLDRHVSPAYNVDGGLITYGATDAVNCDAQVNYVTLSSKTYWQFPLNKFQVNGYSTNRVQQVTSDTGYSWILAFAPAFNAIAAATGAKYDRSSGLSTLPCSGSYPDLVFTIGGVQYAVPPTEYVIDLELGQGTCALAIESYSSGGGFAPDWILGDTWIRSFCNIYDIGNAQIGFAKARHSEI